MTRLRNAVAALRVCAGLLFFGVAVQSMHAQMTSVTAPAGSLKVAGVTIANGSASFTAIDRQTGRAVAVRAGDSIFDPQAITCTVTGGSLSGCSVPDQSSALALTPGVLLGYNITILDAASKRSYTLAGVPGVQGVSWALNTYAPAQPAVVAAVGLTTGSAVPSSCRGAAEFYTQTNPPAQYLCVGNVFILKTGSGGSGSSITWRNAYSSGTTYAVSDAVAYNGSSYLSLQASNTGHQPDTSSSWWGLLAQKGADGSTGATGNTGATGAAGQGLTNKGPWAPSTAYSAYDVVTNGGQTYLVTASHSSPASFTTTNLLLWAAKGADGAQGSTGATGTQGATGNTGATGAAGQGFTNRGAWTASTAYNAYDVVTNGGQTYLVTASHTSPASFTTTNLLLWAAKGADGAQGANGASIAPPTAYSAGTTYAQYALVTNGGQVFQSLQGSNLANTPVAGTATAFWAPIADAAGAAATQATSSVDGVVRLAAGAANNQLGKAASTNQYADLSGIPGGILTRAGAIAYYHFDETSGTSLVDYSGAGNTGTVSVAPTRNGIGYTFTANTQIAELPNAVNAANSFYFVMAAPVAGPGQPTVQQGAFFSTTDSTATGMYFSDVPLVSGVAPAYASGAGIYSPSIAKATNALVTGSVGSFFGGGGPVVLAVICESSGTPSVYINKVKVTNTTTTVNCSGLQAASSGHFRFGPSTNGNWPNGHTYYAFAAYSTADSAAIVSATTDALKLYAQGKGVSFGGSAPGLSQKYGSQIVGIGDSIMCDYPRSGCTSSAASSVGWLNQMVTTNTYTITNFGIYGTIPQVHVAQADFSYPDYCAANGGRNTAIIQVGTNAFGIANNTAAFVWGWEKTLITKLKGYGCRVLLVGMLDRGSTAQSVSYTTWKNALNNVMRGEWRAAGADAFVDPTTDLNIGVDGTNAGANFTDTIHLSVAGVGYMATMVGCGLNGLDGSSPGNMDQTVVTASATLTCKDGGVNVDATAGPVSLGLWSARWQPGRQIRYCNVTPSGSNALTITSNADAPFNNVSGTTSYTVAPGSCATFEGAWNGLTSSSALGYWKKL